MQGSELRFNRPNESDLNRVELTGDANSPCRLFDVDERFAEEGASDCALSFLRWPIASANYGLLVVPANRCRRSANVPWDSWSNEGRTLISWK